MAVNIYRATQGWVYSDMPPFPWLQGLISANALVLTIAVLIRQNRMAQIAEHRAHPDLQIKLLAEQKPTATLKIVDELYRQLSNAASIPANDVSGMTTPSDAHALLHAIKESNKVPYLLAWCPTRARRPAAPEFPLATIDAAAVWWRLPQSGRVDTARK